MSILKKFGDLISPNDPELVEKTLARLSEQDRWNDVFSTKLIELLDKIDKVKSEIRARLHSADERIQKAESVTQAESQLLEKAKQFGGISQRLELAEAAERRALSLAEDAKSQLVKASDAFQNARGEAALAQGRLQKASMELHLARETESRASRLSRMVVRYATGAVVLSWIAVGWAIFLIDRRRPTFWAVICWSILLITTSAFVVRGTRR